MTAPKRPRIIPPRISKSAPNAEFGEVVAELEAAEPEPEAEGGPEDEDSCDVILEAEDDVDWADGDTAFVELPTRPTPYARVDWPSRAQRSPPIR